MIEVLILINENIKILFQSPNNSIDIKNFIFLEDIIKKESNEFITICFLHFILSMIKINFTQNIYKILEK